MAALAQLPEGVCTRPPSAQNGEVGGGNPSRGTSLRYPATAGRPIRNVNRTSGPGLFAKQCAPGNGSVVRVHGIPPAYATRAQVGDIVIPARLRLAGHFRARSSKRAGGFIPRIALDQCLVPERYRTRAPFPSLWCSPAKTSRLRWPLGTGQLPGQLRRVNWIN